ncbi:MAG: methyltransferase domain-containing protein [Patescibacteria group bacterium]
MSDLKQNLICPWCKGILVWQSARINCSRCGSSYALKDGVPDMMVFDHPELDSSALRRWLEELKNFQEWNKGYDLDQAANDLQSADVVHKKVDLLGKVLDIGGATGIIRRYLKPEQEYFVVDPDDRALDKISVIKKLYHNAGQPFNFIRGVGEYLPFRDQIFDTVVMRSVIEHFYNVEKAITETYRVLKIGGKLVVGVGLPSFNTGWRRMVELYRYRGLKAVVKKVYLKLFGVQRHLGHLNEFTLDSLEQLLKRFNFGNIKIHQPNPNTGIYFLECFKL